MQSQTVTDRHRQQAGIYSNRQRQTVTGGKIEKDSNRQRQTVTNSDR